METTENIFCRQIIDIAVGHGVCTAFCSPGSRNTPLLVALDSVSSVCKRVVVDERSAAFQALGYAMVSRRPVLLVCTSGTAVLNYAPAVAEAYYAGIPLIVLSADRPSEWIDQDDSQTIRQYGVLNHVVKGSFDVRAIPEGAGREYSSHQRWNVNRVVNEAMVKALHGKPGPVHINVQLSEPLGLISDTSLPVQRKVTYIGGSGSLSGRCLAGLAIRAAGARILVVAGFAPPDSALHDALRRFASLPNVAVMAETIANLHDPRPLSTMVDSVLCRMSAEERRRMCPDIVISFGGALVSRMLKQFLREVEPASHWNVGHSNYFCDCFKALTEIIDVDPACFFRQMYAAVRKISPSESCGYAAEWNALRCRAASASEAYVASAPWSDLKAIDFMLRSLTLDNLFVSNGTAVRYSQLIPHHCHAEYCNRGVSGIDGCTATAVGGALAYSGRTTLLTGDMSWLYDSGASTLSSVPDSMRIIVMDNSGGGIFRFVKSTASLPSEVRDRYFCVSNLPDVAGIAAAYGFDVMEAHCMEELRQAVAWLDGESDLPRLLVVHTPPEVSADVLNGYFSHLNQNPKP